MRCHWCAGTGEECGCGEGHCTHCYKGEVADPPFGNGSGARIADDTVGAICNKFFEMPIEERIQRIAEVAANITLCDEDVAKFVTFFDHVYRNCTIGEFTIMVAERAEEISGLK